MRLAPIDMEPILDGEVLEIAQPRIDLLERVLVVLARTDARLAGKATTLCLVDDEPREPLAPAPVQAVGNGVLVDQALELLRRAGHLGVCQRRRQMADGHCGDAALGLGRLAGIGDDERVDHRQRADNRLGEA